MCIFLFDQQIAKPQFDALPDSNAQWQTYTYDGGIFAFETQFWIDSSSDTLINGDFYLNLNNAGSYFLHDNGLGQVYCRDTTDTDHLLYDFDVSEGDTVFDVFHLDLGDPLFTDMVVNGVDSVLIAGKYRKRIDISPAGVPDPGFFYWIQGIGGNQGLLTTNGVFFVSIRPWLHCMSANDTIQFDGSNFGDPGPVLSVGQPGNCFSTMDVPERVLGPSQFTAIPNPSTGLFHLGHTTAQISIYNAQGRLLFQTRDKEVDLSAYPPGVYTAVVQTAKGSSALRLVVMR
ncbi:MAG: T9SS type A sorting domain-containing protein [Flavobacteriales bacterium]|nr:T9SS type A sorting domain-containing protein [Flavobacteriales bacterium]